MLSLNEIHAAAAAMQRIFGLKTAILGVKLIGEDEIPPKCRRPKEDGFHLALCQAFTYARRTRHHVALFAEDHWCVWPVINFRLRPLTEEDKVTLSKYYFIRDLDKAYSHFVNEYPYIDEDKFKPGLALAPLDECEFVPDAVMIYCDPSQLRQLLMASKRITGDITGANFDTCDSCGATLIPVLNGTLRFNVSLPDAGEYERGLCGENEMIFSFPFAELEGLSAGLDELEKKGFGYGQLAYDLNTDFPRPAFYNNMFEKWGLDGAEEWMPGVR